MSGKVSCVPSHFSNNHTDERLFCALKGRIYKGHTICSNVHNANAGQTMLKSRLILRSLLGLHAILMACL